MAAFERMVIETRGLADPAPILHALMSDTGLAERLAPSHVVVTVDAVNGLATLGRQPESVKQVAVADQLILQRKSVNDLVRADMQALLSRTDLSSADRQRLDQHFQSIRDMENTMTGMGIQCSADGLNVQAIQAMNSGSAFRANDRG